ncbi:MAG: RluA family pseudouridine synthase [Phycisphaerales bacterium]|nr:RluA family pseudouridine synthase [Phycisphaerales bacterium]
MIHYSVEPNDAISYELRHADEHVLVVEKPPHVVTQPGKKHEKTSLLNGLFVSYGNPLQNLGESRGWGLLHRLDKETSGLVIVALRNKAYDHLLQQFKNRQVKKIYWALVAGVPKPSQAVIQKPIVEVVSTRKKAVIKRGGKPSITAYRTLQSVNGVSLIEARPKTGRLHQIRVHMADVGYPVLGESIYAEKADLPQVVRLCLHAAALSFIHPETGHRVNVQSSWPRDLLKTIKRFGLSEPTGFPNP